MNLLIPVSVLLSFFHISWQAYIYITGTLNATIFKRHVRHGVWKLVDAQTSLSQHLFRQRDKKIKNLLDEKMLRLENQH